MKKSALLVLSLLLAGGLSAAHGQDGAMAPPAPEANVGALTYDEVYALYSYLDFKDIDGDGNGVSVNGRFSNKHNFFSEVGLNWFSTEITTQVPAVRFGGRTYQKGGDVTSQADVINLFGGIGTWFPVVDTFHIVGSGGVGLTSISTDSSGGGSSDSTDVYLQGDILARWLVFGFVELNGGYSLNYQGEDVSHGPVYGASVNISKTWQLILRARLLNDDFNEYGVGVRYRW